MVRADKIEELKNLDDIGDFSDGYHTFNDLYYQRVMLFAVIVRTYPEYSWKSKRHATGEECFGGGWFIVGIDTPEGSYTYHYELKYWDLFECQEFQYARNWDGHTDKDVTRLFSLPKKGEKNGSAQLDISTAKHRKHKTRKTD